MTRLTTLLGLFCLFGMFGSTGCVVHPRHRGVHHPAHKPKVIVAPRPARVIHHHRKHH